MDYKQGICRRDAGVSNVGSRYLCARCPVLLSNGKCIMTNKMYLLETGGSLARLTFQLDDKYVGVWHLPISENEANHPSPPTIVINHLSEVEV